MRQGARHIAALLLCALLLPLAVSSAWADTGDQSCPYCEKVEAFSLSQASLLFWPRLLVQGLKMPRGGSSADDDLFSPEVMQARASLAISPLDIYKGTVVLDSGRADCQRFMALESLRSFIDQGSDFGRINALERQLDYILAQQATIQNLLGMAEERFRRQLTTLMEINQVRLAVSKIERQRITIETELAYLREKTRDSRQPELPLMVAVQRYNDLSHRYEALESHLRSLQAWRVNVRAGMVPQRNVDWFATVELEYNFGGIQQHFAEARGLRARDAELALAKYEMQYQVEILQRYFEISASGSRRELALLDAQLERMRVEQETLEATDSMRKEQFLTMLALERIQLEAERIYLDALVADQTAMLRQE